MVRVPPSPLDSFFREPRGKWKLVQHAVVLLDGFRVKAQSFITNPRLAGNDYGNSHGCQLDTSFGAVNDDAVAMLHQRVRAEFTFWRHDEHIRRETGKGLGNFIRYPLPRWNRARDFSRVDANHEL